MVERIRSLLEQAALSLDFATITARHDSDAAADDLAAARLLIATALALSATPFVG